MYGIVAVMDGLEQQFKALVERIGRYPVTDPAARARVLAEIDAIYPWERAGREAPDLPQRDLDPVYF